MSRPKGAVLVMVLVCLVVAATLSGLVLRGLVREQRQLRRQEDQIQAFWLGESAISRGRVRCAVDGDDTQEAWTIDPASLGDARSSRVSITYRKADGGRDDRLEVIVELESDQGTIREQRSVRLRTGNSGGG